MDISKKQMEFKSGVRRSIVGYLMVFMAALMVFGGLFFSYNSNVQADGSGEEPTYGQWVQEDDGNKYYYMEIKGYVSPENFKVTDYHGANLDFSINEKKHWIKIKEPTIPGNNRHKVRFKTEGDSNLKQLVFVKKEDGLESKLYLSPNSSEFVDLGQGSNYCAIYFLDRELRADEKIPSGRIVKEGDNYYYYLHIEGRIPGDISSENFSCFCRGYEYNDEGYMTMFNNPIELDVVIDKVNNYLKIELSSLPDDAQRCVIGNNYGIDIYFACENAYDISMSYYSSDANDYYRDAMIRTKFGNMYYYASEEMDSIGFSGLYLKQYSAICFAGSGRSVYVKTDLMNCSKNEVVNNVSVYRVVYMDGEIKKAKLNCNDDKSTDSSIVWEDSIVADIIVSEEYGVDIGSDIKLSCCAYKKIDGVEAIYSSKSLIQRINNLALEYSSLNPPPVCKCIAADPNVVLNHAVAGVNMLDDDYFNENYRVTTVFSVVATEGGGYSYGSVCYVNIENKTDKYVALDSNDLSASAGTGNLEVSDYDEDSCTFRISGYSLINDLILNIKPFKRRVWVGSDNNDPWTNSNLSRCYVLKSNNNGDVIKIPDTSQDKGAWYCDHYDVYGSYPDGIEVQFEFMGKYGYEFDKDSYAVTCMDDSLTVGDVGLEYAPEGVEGVGTEGSLYVKGKNCVAFKINTSRRESAVQVTGQKYTEYVNKFKYKFSDIMLSDMVALANEKKIEIEHQNGENNEIEVQTILIPVTDTDDNGDYVQSWTVASKGWTDRYAVSAKDGYNIKKNSDFKVEIDYGDTQTEGEKVSFGHYSDEGESYFEIGNLKTRDYTFLISGVSVIRGLTFNANDSFIIKSKDNEAEFTKVGDSYSLAGAQLDLVGGSNGETVMEYKVEMECNYDRKIFESEDSIETAIKNSNANVVACSVDRRSDTKIDLTFSVEYNKDSESCVIIIPTEGVVGYKKSNVRFDIDVTDLADSIYYDDVVNGIKVKNAISGAESSLTLANGHLRTFGTVDNLSYDTIDYVITVNPEVIDLGKLYLVWNGEKIRVGDEGKEVSLKRNSKGEIRVKLNPDFSASNYKESITLSFNSSEVDGSRYFDLCKNVVLYESGLGEDNDKKRKIALAENEDMSVIGRVPMNGENTFIVQYVDYSQTFDLGNIRLLDEDGNQIGNQGDTTYRSGRTTVNLENIGFNTIKIVVIDSDPEAGHEGNDIARIMCVSPIPSSPPIKFEAIDGAKYYYLAENGKIDLGSPIKGTINITKDQDLMFAVQCDNGYDSSTLKLKANKNEFSENNEDFKKVDVTDENGQYSIYKIRKEKMICPYTISGSAEIKQLSIDFVKNLGSDFGACEYIYNGSAVNQKISVMYGDGISFEVELPDRCNQSDIVVVFTDADSGKEEILDKLNGRYAINNIVSSGTVSIKGSSLKINQYPITFKDNDRSYYKTKEGGNLSGNVNVDHNADYSFRVYAKDGYTLDGSAISLRYSDGMSTTLEPDNDGIYTVSHVTQHCTVSVENVENLVYTVTLEPVLGVTYLNDSDNVIADKVQVKHGSNFEFSVVIDDEYDDSKAAMSIIVNGGKSSKSSAQKLSSGRYVINNVVEDLTIKVGNIKKNTYTVTLRGAEGIDYYDASGKIITGDNSVGHHDDFSFKVELYPAYADSDITVMLGDTPMEKDGNGFYTISRVSENKTVTVVGIDESDEIKLINRINSFPDAVVDLGDVDDIIDATKQYEALSDEKKALVWNLDKLKSLQEQVKAFHHISNDVTVSGVDWYIKLYAIPITDDVDACGRIYKKLKNEYILSLYNVYLWNTLEDTRYTLPEGQTAIITLPTPDMTYFEGATAIHEKDTGKLDFISLSISGDKSTFETDSFSPMGITAARTLIPGRSSLLNFVDSVMQFGAPAQDNDTKKVYNTAEPTEDQPQAADDIPGNIDERFRSRNNRVTVTGSALRLVLVLMILLLIASLIVFFVRRQKDKSE